MYVYWLGRHCEYVLGFARQLLLLTSPGGSLTMLVGSPKAPQIPNPRSTHLTSDITRWLMDNADSLSLSDRVPSTDSDLHWVTQGREDIASITGVLAAPGDIETHGVGNDVWVDTSDIEGERRVPRQNVVVVISSVYIQVEDTVQKTYMYMERRSVKDSTHS